MGVTVIGKVFMEGEESVMVVDRPWGFSTGPCSDLALAGAGYASTAVMYDEDEDEDMDEDGDIFEDDDFEDGEAEGDDEFFEDDEDLEEDDDADDEEGEDDDEDL
jgi:hypothetical protein